MDEKAQQIALCEWAGWTTANEWWFPPDHNLDYHAATSVLPDTNSLDVLHSMRQKLTPNQQMTYTTHRWKICRRATGHIVTDHDMWRFANTNAEQEREALLRTLGLWRD